MRIMSGTKRYTNYNDKNICENCNVEKLKPGNANREYDENGNFTGRWLCNRCNGKHWQKMPYGTNSQLKLIRNCRTRNIKEIYPEMMKGLIFEELTCRWRGVKKLSIENNNFRIPLDHTQDPELGIIQTKGRNMSNYYNRKYWNFDVEIEQHKPFDNIILYCLNEDKRNMEKVYIIPKKEIMIRGHITISKNSSKYSWYEKYRVNEEILKRINEIFQIILIENKIDKID